VVNKSELKCVNFFCGTAINEWFLEYTARCMLNKHGGKNGLNCAWRIWNYNNFSSTSSSPFLAINYFIYF
jgi:hypothetical protein